MSDATPIVEHWVPLRDRSALREFALAQCCRFTSLEQGEVESDWVRPAERAKCLNMLICRSVGPHVDNWHPEWSALWVLRCGAGHALHIADRRSNGHCRPRKPAKADTAIIPLSVGQIVIFNGHRVHWLPSAADGSALVVANFDFENRPTRGEVEALIDAADSGLSRQAPIAA